MAPAPASAAAGAWDVSFMPVDEERKKFVDFGNAYHLLQSTYLVAPGSPIRSVAEANAPGVRIAGAAGTATFRASSKASPQATHLALAGVDGAPEFPHGLVEFALQVKGNRFRERLADPFFLARGVRPCFHFSVDGSRRVVDIGSAHIPLIHVLVLSHFPDEN